MGRNQSLILAAIGQKIGEGFDYPRLHTLMLAAPVSFAGRLEQYIGKLFYDKFISQMSYGMVSVLQ